MKKRKRLRLILTILVIAIIAAQFIPVTRDNPPVKADFNGAAAVKAVLKKSCYDCHSNQTVWPWYSQVAPMSWLVASDVHEARQKLNFSEWGMMPPAKHSRAAEEAWEEVEKGEMPMAVYLIMHSGAKSTEADKAVIREWAEGSAAVDTTQLSESE